MFSVGRRLLVTIFLGTTSLAGPAMAACSITPAPLGATCTGDLSTGVSFVGVPTLFVKDLTADITPGFSQPGVELTLLGVIAAQLDGFISYDGGTFQLKTTGAGIRYLSTGIDGAAGDNRNPAFGAIGYDGAAGGASLGASVAMKSGTVFKSGGGLPTVAPFAAVLAESRGGDGGDGGKVLAGLGTARGGNGAKGGDSGSALVDLGIDAGVRIGVSDGIAPAVHALSQAGAGGDGGEGRADTGGSAHGGNGGRGGTGGTATVNLGDDLITVDGEGPPAGLYPVAGILAQSLGGDAGNGGLARTDIAGPASGGHGNRGGDGGEVSVVSRPATSVTIRTTGNQPHSAIRAESVAGDGGDGGGGFANVIADGNGGDGGAGGTGGTVTIDVNGILSTTGDEAQGIFARSYGGDGGDGGEGSAIFGDGPSGAAAGSGPAGDISITFGGKLSTSGDDANAIFGHSVGGFSGDAAASKGFLAYGQGSASAGAGGKVQVTTLPGTTVDTTGDWSTGVTAQSVGGGGGKGSSASGIIVLGGSGSAGGNGARAAVSNAASINTTGKGSRAISAESRGGGGGDAGSASSLVSIGSTSGKGGSGGPVVVENTGLLSTAGASADGLFAASTGGGGGSANSTSGIVAMGSSASKGGSGGDVSVSNTSSIFTTGYASDGVFLQSLGGGGGDGASTFALSPGFAMAIGGKGGGGGDGGAVSYTDKGEQFSYVETDGDVSRGIHVQSVGGGGGDSASAVAVSVNPLISVSVGASGESGRGGDGGPVSASVAGGTLTQGSLSNALGVLSVGGGGGTAGTSISVNAGFVASAAVSVGGDGGIGGSGGTATVESSGNVTTLGDISPAILAGSVGGGGGHSGVTVAANGAAIGDFGLSIGGKGSQGGNGGDVTVATSGNRSVIQAAGALSSGINALSVGGGGGSAYFVGAANGGSGISVDVGVGASGGAGGHGGTVEVGTEGSIWTGGVGSVGILAGSIGGSGGDGSTLLDASGVSVASLNVSVNKSGGASGNGGDVTVTNAADIQTEGTLAEGIKAHSTSRGGGSSGTTIGASGVSVASVGVTVGGGGGIGGTSGNVSVDSLGAITTQGDFATAIDAKSLAGGGGNAKGSVTANGLTMGAVAVTVGGGGGSGGNAGNVSVSSSDRISTSGLQASGITALSHGGNGGEGGWSAQGSLTAGEISGDVSVTLGGGGGDGGTAGSVDVTTESSISTSDLFSYGILAQSIGGNGGNAGNVYSGNVAFSSEASAQINVGIGGGGGNSGKGGNVQVDNGASIDTDGYFSTGILAQSVGGNGGTGGNVYTGVGTFAGGTSVRATVNVGGGGGNGNASGKVNVDNSGAITTKKGGAAGIHATSIGGGGGVAGNAANLNLGLTGSGEGDSLTVGLDFEIGGKGGTGNDGDAVTVSNTGSIRTEGISSDGITGHSVGGGGGDGGTASSYTLNFAGGCRVPAAKGSSFLCGPKPGVADPKPTKVSLGLTFTIGGNGGGSGNGGEVTIVNDGAVTTTGDLSHAISAHSHGGGGGNGGDGDMGLAGFMSNSTANAVAKLGTFVINPFSLTSQNFAIGGKSGATGDGGDVVVTNSGFLTTTGDYSFGIHAQSVGGGGGNGGAGQNTFFGAVTLGGRTMAAGNGGDVTISGPGTISTTGEGSIGIFAQSVGGGGGTAGDVARAFSTVIAGKSWTDLNLGVGVGLQPDGGDGGDGGAISMTAGPITTTGDLAHGVVAQSVGGSGGVAGIPALDQQLLFAGSTGASGNGGPIDLTINGPLSVSGGGAYGTFLQSVSGTSLADTSGDVTILVNDDITTGLEAENAIVAQSEGVAENGTIAITIAQDATVTSASPVATTIGLLDGSKNTITNNGSLTHSAGGSAVVIGTDGVAGLTVLNNGFLSGSLDAPRTSLTNAAAGTFALGTNIDLGTSGMFLNSGLMSAGGVGSMATSTIDAGAVAQSDSGTLHVEATYPSASDLVILSGDQAASAAALAGEVQPSPIAGLPESGNSGLPKNGTTGQFAIMQSGGRVLDISDLTVSDTSTVDYGLTLGSQPNLPTLFLDYTVDYTPWSGGTALFASAPSSVQGLVNENHTAAGDHIDDLITLREEELSQGSDDLAFVDDLVLHLLTLEDPADLVDLYDRFAPGEIFAVTDAAFLSSNRFADQLNSCPALSTERVALWADDGECAWARLTVGTTNRQRDDLSIDYSEDIFGLSAGLQAEFADNWFAGFAVGWEDSSFDNARFSGNADRFQAGAVLKRAFGATTFSGSVSGGFSDAEFTREIITPDGRLNAEADPTAWWVAGHVRASRDFEEDNLRVTPWFDIGVEHQRQEGFRETAGGPYGLSVDDIEQTFVTVNPMIEVATDLDFVGLEGELSARGGFLGVFGDTERTAEVHLSGIADGAATYSVRDDMTPAFANLGASIGVRLHDRVTFDASIDTLLSDDQQTYIGSARLNFLF